MSVHIHDLMHTQQGEITWIPAHPNILYPHISVQSYCTNHGWAVVYNTSRQGTVYYTAVWTDGNPGIRVQLRENCTSLEEAKQVCEAYYRTLTGKGGQAVPDKNEEVKPIKQILKQSTQ